MNYLLDVNVLVAWGWADHANHERVVRWIAAVMKEKGTLLLTAAIPQLGFIRVSLHLAPGRLTVKTAAEVLAGMLLTLGRRHRFVADDQSAAAFPEWCRTAARTTDAHLLQLAHSHSAHLATLDTGIPGAFIIPQSAEV